MVGREFSLCSNNQIAAYLDPSSPSLAQKFVSVASLHRTCHHLTHYCRHLFILISSHWNIISMRAGIFVHGCIYHPYHPYPVSGTCSCSINIWEWMSEHTEHNHIGCKTSYFSMCLQSVLWGWWCFIQNVYTNWICPCLAAAVPKFYAIPMPGVTAGHSLWACLSFQVLSAECRSNLALS